MKSLKIISAVILLATILTSCSKEHCRHGGGNVITSTLHVSDFDGIELRESADVIITQGDVQSVVVTGKSSVIEHLETTVRNGKWIIELDKRCLRNHDLSIEITIPDLYEVDLSGSGNILVNDFIDQQSLNVDISGSGDIDIYGFEGVTDLDVDINGSGSFTCNSYISAVVNQKVGISGSGTYDAMAVDSDNCDIRMSGSGDCSVFVIKHLDVDISGSGTVSYGGNPDSHVNISGSGDVIHVH